MPRTLLAIDVGGSTTRATLLTTDGRCLGRGRSSGGNPASNEPETAASAMIAAVEAATSQVDAVPLDIAIALIALAGPQVRVLVPRLEAAFRRVGLTGEIVFAGDLLAMFASASPAMNGYCVVAGTGAGAVRIRNGEIERVVDAAGWLVGDLGSGYWLGQEAARAVVADLDGRGEPTALTGDILESLGIDPTDDGGVGRPAPLRRLIEAVYAMRPIELARFAPLVVKHRTDAVAMRLIAAAESHLIANFAAVFDAAMPGPVALGGGIMAHLTGVAAGIGDIVKGAGHQPDIRPVVDGSIGAAVLAMRAVQIDVDDATFATIAASLAEHAVHSGC